MNTRTWRWSLIAVGLVLSTLIAGCGCAPAPPPKCLTDSAATTLLRKAGGGSRGTSADIKQCTGIWAVGASTDGYDEVFGSVLFTFKGGKWRYTYSGASYRGFCEALKAEGAPAHMLDDCFFG